MTIHKVEVLCEVEVANTEWRARQPEKCPLWEGATYFDISSAKCLFCQGLRDEKILAELNKKIKKKSRKDLRDKILGPLMDRFN